MPSGRITVRTKETDALIIERLYEGKLWSDIAKELGVDLKTIANWRTNDVAFNSKCIHAQEVGFDVQADELERIADDTPDVQRARLKSENRRWRLSKQAPGRYGERLDINVQTVDLTSALLDAQKRLRPTSDPEKFVEAEVVGIIAQPQHSASPDTADVIQKPQQKQADPEIGPDSDPEDIFL